MDCWSEMNQKVINTKSHVILPVTPVPTSFRPAPLLSHISAQGANQSDSLSARLQEKFSTSAEEIQVVLKEEETNELRLENQ